MTYRNEPGKPPFWHANGDSAVVLAGDSNDGRTIYTKAMPQTTWPTPPPCECTIEQWITIDGATVRVRNRLTNFLSDTRSLPASGQELPALYTLGPAYRLFTYVGAAPYSNGPLREYTRADGGQIFMSPARASGRQSTGLRSSTTTCSGSGWSSRSARGTRGSRARPTPARPPSAATSPHPRRRFSMPTRRTPTTTWSWGRSPNSRLRVRTAARQPPRLPLPV